MSHRKPILPRPAFLALIALAALSGAAGAPSSARAGDATTSPAAGNAPETALESLGATPSAEAVLRLARKAQFAETAAAERFAGALASHGGYACALGLRTMLRHRDPVVRAAALRGIAQVRLRFADDMDLIRTSCNDMDPGVRDAAYAALAAVGDAADVPLLLDALASREPGAAPAAFAALREMSGAKLRCVALVWRQWWKDTEADVPGRLQKALAVVETGDGDDAGEAWSFIERFAWVRLRDLRDRVTAGLSAERSSQRRVAYRLAALLRLGDLAEPLAAALVWETDGENLRVGLESAKVLGVCVATRPAQAAR